LHPIAATIQSIGVVRKTIERGTSLGIGRIAFPAIIFHGSFDFAPMFIAYMVHPNEAKNENEDKAKQLALLAITFGFSIFVMILDAIQSKKNLTYLTFLTRVRFSRKISFHSSQIKTDGLIILQISHIY